MVKTSLEERYQRNNSSYDGFQTRSMGAWRSGRNERWFLKSLKPEVRTLRYVSATNILAFLLPPKHDTRRREETDSNKRKE